MADVSDTLAKLLAVVPTKEAYEDGLEPAMREAGKALGTAFGALNSVLLPLMLFNHTMALTGYRAKAFLDAKFLGNEDKRVEPPMNVAAPIMMNLALIESDETMNDVRNLYLELLAASMDSDRRKKAHPAFVDIVRQLSPDEATHLQNFANALSAGEFMFPVVSILAYDAGRGAVEFARISPISHDNTNRAVIDNLERLLLIEFRFDVTMHDQASMRHSTMGSSWHEHASLPPDSHRQSVAECSGSRHLALV